MDKRCLGGWLSTEWAGSVDRWTGGQVDRWTGGRVDGRAEAVRAAGPFCRFLQNDYLWMILE